MAQRLAKSPSKKAREMVARNRLDKEKKTKVITSEDRARYKKRKHLVRALEGDNHSKIIAFATLGEVGYWKMIGNSAIYYAYHEAKRLKKKVVLRRDTDKYDKDQNGFVAIRDIEVLKKDLEFLGGKPSNEISDPAILVFEMGVYFSDEDLKTMLRKNEMLMEQMNQMTLPKISDPEVYQQLRLICEKICKNHRTTEASLRRLTYEKLVEPAVHAEGMYIMMSRNHSNLEKTKMGILIDLEKIIVGTKILMNSNIWGINQLWEIADSATSCKQFVEKMGHRGNGNTINE